MNLFNAVAEKLGWSKDHHLNPRESRILAHYQRQLDRSFMDQFSALDRCFGDLAGRNYHPKLEQRSF